LQLKHHKNIKVCHCRGYYWRNITTASTILQLRYCVYTMWRFVVIQTWVGKLFDFLDHLYSSEAKTHRDEDGNVSETTQYFITTVFIFTHW